MELLKLGASEKNRVNLYRRTPLMTRSNRDTQSAARTWEKVRLNPPSQQLDAFRFFINKLLSLSFCSEMWRALGHDPDVGTNSIFFGHTCIAVKGPGKDKDFQGQGFLCGSGGVPW